MEMVDFGPKVSWGRQCTIQEWEMVGKTCRNPGKNIFVSSSSLKPMHWWRTLFPPLHAEHLYSAFKYVWLKLCARRNSHFLSHSSHTTLRVCEQESLGFSMVSLPDKAPYPLQTYSRSGTLSNCLAFVHAVANTAFCNNLPQAESSPEGRCKTR